MPLFILLTLLLFGCSQENPSSSKNTLRMNMIEDPTSLDPRLVHDLPTNTALQMLYEGLFRRDHQGTPQPALVDNFSISPDMMTYTFHLKPSVWSDGSPLTAQDFEESWKSILNPAFPSPNSYQLYVIKNAKAAREGKVPLEQVGIRTEGSDTLIVELEKPVPYFSELISSYVFLPVHKTLRESEAERGVSPSQFVSNGPFQLETWQRRRELTLTKNPHYRDRDNVKLDKIVVMILDVNTAYQMFMAGELDWIGSPHSFIPIDAIPMLKKQGQFFVSPSAGTHWVSFNTSTSPFDHPMMRKAFSEAIDRRAIIEHVLLGEQTPAYSVVPKSFNIVQQENAEYNIASAWRSFQEALKEMNLTKEELPPIKLIYQINERSHKIAQILQQQWNKAFGLTVELANMEFKVMLDKVAHKDYQITLLGWYADYRDPINFFEIFKYKSNASNSTGWENSDFQALVDQSDTEADASKRNDLLIQAEKILIAHMPVAPLYFNAYNYSKKSNLKGVYLSDLGYLDFKEAYFE